MVTKRIKFPGIGFVDLDVSDDVADDVIGVSVCVVLQDGTTYAQAKIREEPDSTYEIHPSGALIIKNGYGKVLTTYGPGAWIKVSTG